ncbi:flagellar hook-basal body complex protein FliE [Curvibacter sp. CHRR-16]|uniref:flagellar hook-basal body complex protein FliE n=1 Tax=Curvibacter sp. CHRR-16 TaxID=2835872 RepID=UPI001BDB28E6|nr:flagellar hook-basal body complex protein FliE [Curvibacter sp. CHRR-16]MBT0569525.1 flagellar hook-basal body complex protein FliE [Curvibacter sp. CHRR-16]
MDVKLSPVSSPLRTSSTTATRPMTNAQGTGTGFATAFRDALQNVSAQQNESTRLQEQVQLENPNVSLEETMVSIQKAQIGFQSTLHVRNRLVQAYTDIMNMQV